MKRRGFFGAVAGGALALVGLKKKRARPKHYLMTDLASGPSSSSMFISGVPIEKVSRAELERRWVETSQAGDKVYYELWYVVPEGWVLCDGSHRTPQIHPPGHHTHALTPRHSHDHTLVPLNDQGFHTHTISG